jgi:hypothetical protein
LVDFSGIPAVFLVVLVFLVLLFLSSKSEPSDAEVYLTSLVARPDLRVDIFCFLLWCLLLG